MESVVSDKRRVSDRIRDRTLLDMLRDDKTSGSKKNWKAFRDKLRLKRAGAAWTSTVPIPASDIPIQSNANRMMIRRGSLRYANDANNDESDGEATRQLNSTGHNTNHMPERQSSRLLPVETDPPEDEQDNNSPEGEQKEAAEEGDQQAQMSLMSLLADDGSAYMEDEEADHDEHHAEEEEEDDGDSNICCGCTVKHKGTAFGPCGHTFCKYCTKELHVQRGNCPTCNNFILEILDIY